MEARDQLEIKIARVNARLAAIAHDGNFVSHVSAIKANIQWRRELHKFESYASQLATHTEHLRAKVDKEKIDMERLHEGVYMWSFVEDQLTYSRC